MNLSWVPEAGRSAFCSKAMWWWWSRDDDDDDSWGWIIRMGGMHRKRQKPKSQNDHTPKKTHRNPRKKKKKKKKERKKEIHQSSEWVCHSLHTKLISMSPTSKFFRRKLCRNSTIWLNVKLSSPQKHFCILTTTLRTDVHPYCCSNSAWFKHFRVLE